MQLWTHHPSNFRVDDRNLKVDYTLGQYAQRDMVGVGGFAYRDVLPKLHDKLGTTQFLWCCTQRGCYPRAWEGDDSMEWELNVPLAHILTFYRVSEWENILSNRNGDWHQLLIAVGKAEPAGSLLHDLGALVRVPLKPEWAKCHGQLPLTVVGVNSSCIIAGMPAQRTNHVSQ